MLKSILTALILSMDFETGYVPQWSTTIYKTPQEYSHNTSDKTFYVSLSPKFEVKGFFGNFDLTYYAASANGRINFSPYHAVWSNEFGYTYRMVTIGYKHHCQHSVIPMRFQIDNPPKNIDGAMDNVYLRIGFSTKR